MNIRGIRHISTLQGLANRLAPHKREAGLAELTHLEHEKARLERELKMLIHNLEHAENHLGQVQERITLLERALYEGYADHAAALLDSGSGGGEGERAGRREVSLEY